jgi:peptidoglycan/LPS O-acetylase OafA/YrhL
MSAEPNTCRDYGIADEALAEQRALSSKRHFEVLDGLRGVAAIAVMLFHSYDAQGLFHNAGLAVDLFFLLSGFVLAYSNDDRLQQGMPVAQFLLRRLIRLYPMILLGGSAGIAFAIVQRETNAAYLYSFWQIAVYGCLTLLLLFYGFNLPFWSLFFELVANAFYALFAKHLSPSILALVVLISLLSIGLGGPLSWGNKFFFALGFAHVAAGFFGGVLLYKLWKQGSLPSLNGNFIILSALLTALFVSPWDIHSWLFLPAFAVMTTIIAFGIGARPNRLDKYCALLGQISYPLYALHWPALYMFVDLERRLGLKTFNYNFLVVVHCLAVLIIAYLAMHFYETPVRSYLTRKFASR